MEEDLLHDRAVILGPSGLSSVAPLLKAGCRCLAWSISRKGCSQDAKANALEGTALAPSRASLCW